MTDLQDLTERILAFRDARDWSRFHTPRNLAASISIEAGELLELFQWETTPASADSLDPSVRDRVAMELADVVIYAILLAHETGIDIPDAVSEKLALNDAKYPVDRAKGKSTKYTEL